MSKRPNSLNSNTNATSSVPSIKEENDDQSFTPKSSLASLASPAVVKRAPGSSEHNDTTNNTNDIVDQLKSFITLSISSIKSDVDALKKAKSKHKAHNDSSSSSSPTDDDDEEDKQADRKKKKVASSRKTKLSIRNADVISRVAQANATKLGLSEKQIASLSSLIKDETHSSSSTPAVTVSDDGDSEEDQVTKQSQYIIYSDDEHGSDSEAAEELSSRSRKQKAKFVDGLLPYDINEQQSMQQALADALKIKTKTSKKFESEEALNELFTKQLVQLINVHGKANREVRAFMKYASFIDKLKFTHGLDAASDYHFKLFNEIKENVWSLKNDGHYNAEIIRLIDAKYDKLNNQIKSKPKSFGSSSSGSATKKVGKSFYCSHHGNNPSHATVNCYTLSKDKKDKGNDSKEKKKE